MILLDKNNLEPVGRRIGDFAKIWDVHLLDDIPHQIRASVWIGFSNEIWPQADVQVRLQIRDSISWEVLA